MRNVGAVILAAGASARLGRPKQLVEFRGKSLLRAAVDAAGDAGCRPIAVVIGTDQAVANAVSLDLTGLKIEISPNERWHRGIGTSLRTGIARIARDPAVGAAVLLVCDQPFVSPDLIKDLIALWDRTSKPIVASAYADTIGVPALFDRTCFDELLALPDDQGAKAIIRRDPARVQAVQFSQGAVDIDTPEDLEKLLLNPAIFSPPA